MTVCPKCKLKECLWKTHRNDVILVTDLKGSNGELPKNVMRKLAYQESVRVIYGVLGKGNRIQLPTCVVEGVRREYPDVEENYMGYKSE